MRPIAFVANSHGRHSSWSVSSTTSRTYGPWSVSSLLTRFPVSSAPNSEQVTSKVLAESVAREVQVESGPSLSAVISAWSAAPPGTVRCSLFEYTGSPHLFDCLSFLSSHFHCLFQCAVLRRVLCQPVCSDTELTSIWTSTLTDRQSTYSLGAGWALVSSPIIYSSSSGEGEKTPCTTTWCGQFVYCSRYTH